MRDWHLWPHEHNTGPALGKRGLWKARLKCLVSTYAQCLLSQQSGHVAVSRWGAFVLAVGVWDGSLLVSEDDQWYRASVLAYASEESVLVGYVDYGNFEILSLKRLCPIIPKLLDLPMQALNCVLAGMKCCGPPILQILKMKMEVWKELVTGRQSHCVCQNSENWDPRLSHYWVGACP